MPNPQSYFNKYKGDKQSFTQDSLDTSVEIPFFDDLIDVMRTAFSPWDTFRGIWNDVTGVTAQSREFAQQEYLQDKQWEHESESARMQRGIEAGINPNLMAQGISGSAMSSSAPSVPSATSAGSSGASLLGTAAQTALGAVLAPSQEAANLAAANASNASAAVQNVTAQNLPFNFKAQRYLWNANAAKSLSDIGVNDATIAGLLIDNKYRGIQNELDVLTKCQNIDNMRQEYLNFYKSWEVMDTQIKKTMSDIEVNISTMSLQEAQAAVMDAQKQQLDLLNWKANFDNEFCKRWNCDRNSPIGNMAFGIATNPNLSDNQIGMYIKTLTNCFTATNLVDYELQKDLIDVNKNADFERMQKQFEVNFKSNLLDNLGGLLKPQKVTGASFGPFSASLSE